MAASKPTTTSFSPRGYTNTPINPPQNKCIRPVFSIKGAESGGSSRHRILHLTCPLSLCVFELTFHRLCVGVGIGEVGGDAQGAAVGTGLDARRLEQQRFPGGAVSQTHHLPQGSPTTCWLQENVGLKD